MFFYSLRRICIIGIMLAFFCISHLCLADTIDTQLSSDQVSFGEPVVVTYMLNDNSNSHSPDFSQLQKDFRILNTNYGSSIKMVNGVTSLKTFWQLQLLPKKSGELWIPAIAFGNKQSSARKLIVSSSSIAQTTQKTASTNKQNDALLVQGKINTHSPYVQSQFIYTFKLFFRTQLRNPSIEFPSMKDITFLQLNDHPVYQTVINGNVYNVIEKRFALFPKKVGSIILPPIQFHAYILDDSNNFYNDLFYFSEPKPVTIATNVVNLSVRDIPTNYQGTLWLPAKNISLTEAWSNHSNTWEVGIPVTRTIKITAQGLRADQLPDITIEKIKDVNVYVDQPKRNNIIQDNLVIGILEQKVTYIPNTPLSFIIPTIDINWWNTETNTNAVSQLSKIAVHMKGVVGHTGFTSQNRIVSQPLVITKSPGSATVANVFYTTIWFWISCVLFIILLVMVWFIFRRKAIANNEAHTQSRVISYQTTEITEKEFEQACYGGQALQAQHFLLAWAKKNWPHTQINLTTLRQIINDEQFNAAIEELEEAIYARVTKKWHGETLLSTFRNVKSRPYTSSEIHDKKDPLPDLYLF